MAPLLFFLTQGSAKKREDIMYSGIYFSYVKKVLHTLERNGEYDENRRENCNLAV